MLHGIQNLFDKDGFVAVARLITEDECCALCTAIDGLVSSDGITGDDGLTWIFRPEQWIHGLAAAAMGRARLVAANLMSVLPDRIAVSSRLFYKPGNTGVATPWHQDRPYVTDPAVLRTITCWLTLDEVDEGNGCMVYAPGSHRNGIAMHETQDEGGFRLLTAAIPAIVRPVPLPAGGCVFHHDLTLHASGKNQRSAPRRALAIRCELMAT
jgi:Phytanoyl-CoA dioxygenase (PhyH)